MYLEKRGRPVWMDADQLLSRFPPKDRGKAFLEFMRSKIEEPLEVFYRARRRAPVLGSDRFMDKIRRGLKKKPVDFKEVPEGKGYVQADGESCLKAVGRVYGIGREELLKSRRGRRNEARAMGMYVCRRLGGMKHEAIAEVFGVGGYSAVSSAIGRTQAEMIQGGKIARRFEQIRGVLQR